MEIVNVERIQRQLVSIIVEGARLKHEARIVSEGAEGCLLQAAEDVNQTAARINISISELYNLLPKQFLPTAATLRAFELEEEASLDPVSPSPTLPLPPSFFIRPIRRIRPMHHHRS
jgi:hypothetical protein